jgi:hypothetical protein
VSRLVFELCILSQADGYTNRNYRTNNTHRYEEYKSVFQRENILIRPVDTSLLQPSTSTFPPHRFSLVYENHAQKVGRKKIETEGGVAVKPGVLQAGTDCRQIAYEGHFKRQQGRQCTHGGLESQRGAGSRGRLARE